MTINKFNMNAFEAYCDHEAIAADPDAYGDEFNQYFVGEIDIEDYLCIKMEDDSKVPNNILPYIDFDLMAKDALKPNGNMLQIDNYLFCLQ